jgi:hypothetical protein
MSDDIRNDPEFQRYAADVKKNLIPKLRGSACTVSIAVVAPGTMIPSKLALVADVIVEADWKNPEKMQQRIGEAVERVLGLQD